MTEPQPRRAALTAQLAFGLGFLALAGALLTRPLAPPERVPCAYRTPILCAELPDDGAHLAAVLAAPPNPEEAWRWVLWTDMGFLVAYGLLLALAGFTTAHGGGRAARAVAVAAAIAAVLGAAFDVSENL